MIDGVADWLLGNLQFRPVALACLVLAVVMSGLRKGLRGDWPHTSDFLQLILAFIGLYTAIVIGSALFLKQPRTVTLDGKDGLFISGIDEQTLALAGLAGSVALIITGIASLRRFLTK